METFDTNVVLRLIYRDDRAQAERAARAWESAARSGGIYLTATVLIECAWVLRVAAKFDRRSIAAALANLCNAEGVTVESEVRVRRALARYEGGGADFSDSMILEAAREADAVPVVTFDDALGRESDAVLLPAQGP